MSGPPSVNDIERALEKQRAKGKYFDDAISFQLSTDLKAHILANSSEKTKSLILLSHVLRSTKPNKLILNVIDEPLLSGILSSVTKSTSADYMLTTLRILLVVSKGEIFENVDPSEYLAPLLKALDENLVFVDTLSTKLYTENIDLILKSLDFISIYFSLKHYQLGSLNHLINFFLRVQKAEYFIILNNILQDKRFNPLLTPSVEKLNSSCINVLNVLNGINIDETNSVQIEMMNQTQQFCFRNEEKEDRAYIAEHYSVLQLIDFYFFSQSSNITFMKSYHEQVMFNDNKNKNNHFPLVSISQMVTNLLLTLFQSESETKNIRKYKFLRDLLHFNIIAKFLEIWKESGAEQDEIDNLTPLVQILLKHINDELKDDEMHVVDKILSTFKSTNYKQLREMQLNNIKNESLESSAKEIKSFDKILKEQVFDFIKNQRFLQLSKGAWVFTDLPTFNMTDDTPSTNYFFIILSPNYKNLLYKEYKFKTQNIPDIDKTGRPIEINAIATFKIEEIQQVDPSAMRETENSRLINLIGKTIINKITLLNRKGKTLFTFYSKKQDSFNYLDGLNLLLGNNDRLSDELNFQIKKLFEIRKTVQLLNYTKDKDQQIIDDSHIYDSENLNKLTRNFYYS